jgi:hypothetical protein
MCGSHLPRFKVYVMCHDGLSSTTTRSYKSQALWRNTCAAATTGLQLPVATIYTFTDARKATSDPSSLCGRKVSELSELLCYRILFITWRLAQNLNDFVFTKFIQLSGQ